MVKASGYRTIDLPATITGVVASEEFAKYLSVWRKCLEGQRAALLSQVHEMELALGIDPTTADIRKWYRKALCP